MTTEEFISKAKKVHGDKYDYSLVEYVNNKNRVTIICPIHGPFEQRPVNHLRGHGCMYCGNAVKHTKEEFIEAARKVHGDKYDYSQVDYVDNKTKVKIICPIHGMFEQTPSSHLQGRGCKYCGGSVKHTKDTFIEAARKVHGNKYDYSKVEYVNNRTPIIIICPIHGEFKQSPNEHLQGKGCQRCANNIKRTTEEFIENARKIHGDKYDYSRVKYIDCHTKVKIICPIHGEFELYPNDHVLKGCGCPYCGGSVKYTTETFIDAARKIHGNKYDYSKVKYVNNKTKVTIICPIHGEFEKIPSAHLKGQGCQECIGLKRYTTETFITAARKIHGDKYDYSKVNYVNAYTKIKIICPIHGEFELKPCSHLNGHGCSHCQNSKLTELVIRKLELNNISYIIEQKFDWLIYKGHMRLDIYLPKYNVAIECHGIQHFLPIDFFGGEKQFIDNLKRDKAKHDLCETNGVKIFYFSEEENDNYEFGRVYNDVDELLNAIITKL